MKNFFKTLSGIFFSFSLIVTINVTPLFSQFAGGDGTIDDPYQIANVDQLQEMKNLLSSHFILINNIDASATSGWNGGLGFEPVGEDFASQFTGSLNGDGYIITGLTINRPSQDFIGLFGFSSGELTDVAMQNVNIAGKSYVGGLVGGNEGGITTSYATGFVEGTSNSVGGLVGENNLGTISTSYATGSVSGGDGVTGGLVGRNAGEITFSYATGSVSGDYEVGGLVGGNYGTITASYTTGSVSGSGSNVGGLAGFDDGTITTSYATGSVSGSGNAGGLVGGNEGGPGAITNSYWNITTSGQASSSGGTGLTESQFRQQASFTGFDFVNDWDFSTGSTSSYPFLQNNPQDPPPGYIPFAGDGTVGDPYQIANVNQLQEIKIFFSSHFILINNIDASATSEWNGGLGFEPVGEDFDTRFRGSLNGNGFIITGLTIDRPSQDYIGLFGISSGELTDVAMENINISGQSSVGGLVGYNLGGFNFGTITASYATGSVSGVFNIGGLVGQNEGTITTSYSTGSVLGESYVGGLTGRNSNGTVTASYSTGSVSGSSFLGGLVGQNEGTITTSYSTGSVLGLAGVVGGLVGQNDGTITISYSTGSVSGPAIVGGLAGRNNSGTITNSYWNITTSGQVTSSGGTGLTESEFRQQTSFSGFDFNSDWAINDFFSYPFLQNNTQNPAPGYPPDNVNITSSTNLPGGTFENITISGAGTVVTLTGSVTITGTLDLNEGNLAIGANTLTLSGPVNFSGGKLEGSATSNLTIDNSASITGSLTLNDQVSNGTKINNIQTGTDVTLGSFLDVRGDMTIDAGNFNIGQNQLRLSGALNLNAGNLVGGTESRIQVLGSGDGLNLPSIDLGILIVNRPDGVVLNGSVNISGSVRLGQGLVVNASNFILGNNARIQVDNGSFDAPPVFNNQRIDYSGSTERTTGNELPSSPTPIWKLNIDNPAGIILSSNITVDNSLLLIDGSLNINGKSITLALPNKSVIEETAANRIYGTSGSISVNAKIKPEEINYDPWNLGLKFTVERELKNSTITRGFAPALIGGSNGIFRSYELNLKKNLNTELNATIVFTYRDDELNGNEESSLVLYYRNSPTKPWFSFSGQVLDMDNNTITVTGLDALPKYITARGVAGDNIVINDRQQNENMERVKKEMTGDEKRSIEENEVEVVQLPSDFDMVQNYPNPFNPVTTLKFAIPESDFVTVKVFDITGREIAELVNGTMDAGYHTVQFDGSDLASGIYFYRITTGSGFEKVMRMSLVK